MARTLLDEISCLDYTQEEPKTRRARVWRGKRKSVNLTEIPGIDIIEVGRDTYQVAIAGRLMLFERARVEVRLSGRYHRHLSRWLVGWVGGIFSALFLGVAEDVKGILARAHLLHRWLDWLIGRLGLDLLDQAFAVMEVKAGRMRLAGVYQM